MLPIHKSLLLVIPNSKHMQQDHLFFIPLKSGSKLFPFHSIALGREKDTHTFFLVLANEQVARCLLSVAAVSLLM